MYFSDFTPFSTFIVIVIRSLKHNEIIKLKLKVSPFSTFIVIVIRSLKHSEVIKLKLKVIFYHVYIFINKIINIFEKLYLGYIFSSKTELNIPNWIGLIHK